MEGIKIWDLLRICLLKEIEVLKVALIFQITGQMTKSKNKKILRRGSNRMRKIMIYFSKKKEWTTVNSR
jgi:hypothetical protein